MTSNKEQVWAVMMVRNEADIIGYTIDHLVSEGVDGILIGNSFLSNDGTNQILEDKKQQYAIPIHVVIDTEPALYQARFMDVLTARAHQLGASWIVPCDADEIWYATSGKTLADELRAMDQKIRIVDFPLWPHGCTDQDDESDPNPFTRMQWMDPHNMASIGKVSFRYAPDMKIDDGNHIILGKIGVRGAFGIRHFEHRGIEHFIRKSKERGEAIELAKDLPEWKGTHNRLRYRCWQEHGDEGLRTWFNDSLFHRNPAGKGFEHSPAPFMKHAKKAQEVTA